MQRLLLLVLIVALSSYTYWLFMKREKFSNSPLLVYMAEMNVKSLNIVMDRSLLNYSGVTHKNLQGIKNVRVLDADPGALDSDMTYTDVFSYTHFLIDQKVLTVHNEDQKCLLFIKSKDSLRDESLLNVINNKGTIGYINDVDLLLLKMLCLTMGIDSDLVANLCTKVSFPKTDKITNRFFDNNNISCLILYSTLGDTQVCPEKFDPNFKMDFLQYEGVFDIDKLKFLMPYCNISNIDLSLSFPTRFVSDKPVRQCISFDMLLCGPPNIEQDDSLGLELNNILVRFSDSDTINFYTMYLNFYKQTIHYINGVNQHIQDRDSLPILEQFEDGFEDGTIDITAVENVDGFYDHSKQTFTIPSGNIDGIPLIRNSRISLTLQDRDEENGNYFVEQSSDRQAILQRSSALKDPKKDDPTRDPRYECYGFQSIKSRGQCESNFDEMGQPKKQKTYWDRRCEVNEDCPFYQSNKNYKNYFGGCNDGYCQMPVGVKRVSYTKYDPQSKPMCYNCKDQADPYCCDEQNDRNAYPELVSPDYAFPLDSYERMKQMAQNAAKWYY